MDWRSAVLIVCFVIFTPYAWEYLVAFFSGWIPADALSGVINSEGAAGVTVQVAIDSVIYSLFACVLIAAPLGAILTTIQKRIVLIYAGLSTLHLLLVFPYESVSTSDFYWPLVTVDAIAFFIWLIAGIFLGAALRNFYRRIREA
ncbi:MAG: hypothetical protein AAF434_02740 [Pseudomonadota bacterium]